MPNNNTNGDNNDVKERRIRDMLGLVKFCLESTKNEDAPSTDHPEPMDPDRMAWLQEAISNMTVDTTRQLLENLAIVKETVVQLAKNPNENIAIQKTCSAMEILTDLCEEIDYAADFAKLDGFSIFKPLIECDHEELIVKACELIAALAQNNPVCQHIAMSTRLLEQLIDFVSIKNDSSHVKARSYALYAISSIIRSNQEVRTHFETILDGLSVLTQLFSYQEPDKMIDTISGAPKQGSFTGSEDGRGSSVYWWRKLRIRSIFLFRTLCSESTNASKFFFEKQAINQVTDQLRNSKDSEIREHLLHALKAFLDSLDNAKRTESMKSSPDLRDVVEQIQKSISATSSNDEYDLTDIKSICEELLKLIDGFQ